jgi:ribosomal protein S18 acetylase RimI-like enzyme
LLAHIAASQTSNFTIQEEDMTLTGHQYDGRTIALHSLAVLPELQGLHLGQTLMKSYIHMMKGLGLYDRISLITYEHLVSWYELLGFTYHGPSNCKYGGEEWHDMVRFHQL